MGSNNAVDNMDNELYQISTSVAFPGLEDDDRNDLLQQRKLSGSGSISIPASVYSRRSSRNSPLDSPGQNYGKRGSQASLNFHEISINTLHINPMASRRRKNSIPADQYSNIGSFSFGTAETTSSRAAAGETDVDSLYQDDPERPSKRRATEGSRRSSQATEISIRPPSPASVVSVRPLYNFRDEPDWEVSLRDSAVSYSRRSSWMENIDTSNESRRGSMSSAGSHRKRKSRSADSLAQGGDKGLVSRTSTPTEARTPTQTTFSADIMGRMDVRSRRESRRLSAASSARMRRRSSSTGHSIRLERRGSETASHRRRSTDTGRISLQQDGSLAMANASTLNPGGSGTEYVSAGDTWEGIDRDAILDVKPNSFRQLIRVGFHSFKRGEEFEDHLSVIGQTDDWAVMKDKTSDKWLSGVLGGYQVIRPGTEGNQQSKADSNSQQSKARHESPVPIPPKKDILKDVHLRRTPNPEQVALADIRIHHHSAVDAFSITRSLKHDHITHMERVILLATKKSLRQYTNTRTTNSLQSHGHLDDNKNGKGKSKRERMQGVVESSAAAGLSSGDRSPSFSRPSTADSVGGTSALSSTLASTSGSSLSLSIGDLTTVTADMPSGSSVRQGISDADPSASPPQASGSSRRKIWTLFKSSSSSLDGSRTDSKKSRAESQKTPEERAIEKRRAEEFAKSFQGSFVQSGLLPKMPQKQRKPKNYPEPCKALRVVGYDQYCMVLPLWGDGPRRRQRVVNHSRSATPDIPIESRKFLLVYLIPIAAPPNHTPVDPIDKPLPSHAYRYGFKVHGRILCYEQLSTSGIRLPIHGLVVRTTSADLLAPPAPPSPEEELEDPIMATITKKKSRSMVLLHFEAFIKFGLATLRDEPAAIFHDKVDLTELGWAVTEMIWSGCFGLLTFGT